LDRYAIMWLIALIWGGYDLYARWQERRLSPGYHRVREGRFSDEQPGRASALNFAHNSVDASA